MFSALLAHTALMLDFIVVTKGHRGSVCYRLTYVNTQRTDDGLTTVLVLLMREQVGVV
jgi:hypothetical protein